jgi:dihydropteroate synthase
MKNTINIGGKVLVLDEPVVMGILNSTPDSFYKDSRFNPKEEGFIKKATSMVEAGAKIMDIGGYSTRPGAAFVSVQEEIDRIVPAVEAIKRHFPQVGISVDTFRSEVAKYAIEAGAHIINDISGGDFDEQMFSTIIKYKPVYVLMHQAGKNMEDMHIPYPYKDIVQEVSDKLFKKANFLRENGIKDILLDPGFGFSKTIQDNYTLLQNLHLLNNPHFPLLVGMSRKSMIYKSLGITPEESLPYSLYLHNYAVERGARIIRVHDVAETMKMLQLFQLLNQ